ncbi:MAG: alkaline phosphatase family protein, partial [Gemmatimonadaceae bacterium]
MSAHHPVIIGIPLTPCLVSVIVLLADGLRADAMADITSSPAHAPHLARLRAEGSLHTVTSVFPSVTGPAYTPFLMGRFPGPVGLPGLRWYDRSRARCVPPDFTRSYLGAGLRFMDGDLAAGAPTAYELTTTKLGAMSMINRGLRRRER